MIKPLEEKYLEDVATAHLLAWQKTFKGILSKDLLSSLNIYEFLSNWKQHLENEKRKNFVVLNDKNIAIGFISFESAEENNQWSEIIGIYIHPDYWDQGYGKALMKKAVTELKNARKYSKIILWTMTANVSARNFYEKAGFKLDATTRISVRKGEQFEECRYSLTL